MSCHRIPGRGAGRKGDRSGRGPPLPSVAHSALCASSYDRLCFAGPAPADVTNLKLVIQASEPQGNGITRTYSKALAFDDPYIPVSTAIDIKAKYEAKCGAPSAGSPKVFFKYFYVNTATGEKSGEVLAQAKLSE